MTNSGHKSTDTKRDATVNARAAMDGSKSGPSEKGQD